MASTTYKEQLDQLENEQRIMMQHIDRFTKMKQELLANDIKFIQQARLLKRKLDDQRSLINSIRNDRGKKGLTTAMLKKERFLTNQVASVEPHLSQIIADAEKLAQDLN